MPEVVIAVVVGVILAVLEERGMPIAEALLRILSRTIPEKTRERRLQACLGDLHDPKANWKGLSAIGWAAGQLPRLLTLRWQHAPLVSKDLRIGFGLATVLLGWTNFIALGQVVDHITSGYLAYYRTLETLTVVIGAVWLWKGYTSQGFHIFQLGQTAVWVMIIKDLIWFNADAVDPIMVFSLPSIFIIYNLGLKSDQHLLEHPADQ